MGLGVLLDVDELLVSTETLWWEATREVAQALGGTIGQAELARTVGLRVVETVEIVERAVGAPLSAPERQWWAERLEDRFAVKLEEQGAAWRPGAAGLVDELRATPDISMGVVSSSPRGLVELMLRGKGDAWGVFVCGDDVASGKPAPEPYARAAALVGLPALRCVAVEDSAHGAQSASAAGYGGVVVVPSLVDVEPGPGRVIRPSLEAVNVPLLRSLVEG